MSGHIHIGTSGWSYKHWKGLYYPQKLRSRDWLQFYTNDFRTTEINASFYRLPKSETVEKWVNEVPDDFLFCPKMSRYLSHMKKLHDPEESLERFFNIMEPMKPKMGPVLIQLPHFLKFHFDTADYFYSVLKKKYRAYDFVMEVRHESWMEEVSLTLMAKYDIGFVISHSNNEFPYAEHITAKNIYVRFHGPKELYASKYDEKELAKYIKKFRKWMREGHEIWVYFNNDIFGYATENAKRLQELSEK